MNSFFRRHKVAVLWAVAISFLVGSVVLFSFGRYGSRKSPAREEVVLTVNGVKVSRAALNQAYEQLVDTYTRLYRLYGMDFNEQLRGTDGAFTRQSLTARAAEGIIRRVIIEQESKRLGISVPRAEVEKAFQERYRNYLQSLGVDEETFAKYLGYRGISLAQFQKDLRTQVEAELREQKLHTYVVGPIQPTEEELLAYYNEHKDRYQSEPERIRIAHILIKDDEELARKVLEEAKAPDADFAALAAEYSEDEETKGKGGVIDWFSRGGSGLSSEVEDKAFSLQEGEVALVEDHEGFHIVKLLGRKPAVYKSFDEVKEEVRESYTKEEDDRRWNEWYGKKREQAELVVNDPVLQAFILRGQGDTEGALQLLLEAKEQLLSADPYLDYYIGRLYEALYLEVGTKRAELESKESRTPEEDAELAELKAKEQEYKGKVIERYLAFADSGEADEALYNRVLNLDPKNARAHLGLAGLYAEQGRYVEADREYQLALEAEPGLVEAIVGQGDVAMEMGLYGRAIERYQEALKLQTGSFTISLKLAEAYIRDGRPEEARPLVEEALGRAPGNTAALKLMGDLLVAEGKPGEAIAYYEKAAEKGAGFELELALGDAYRGSGEREKAEAIYNELVRRYPYRPEAYERLGDLYRESGDPGEALRWYRDALKRAFETELKEEIAEKIVELAPDDLDARFKLASYYREGYKYDAAIGQYQAILERDPGNLDALIGLGDCYVPKTEYDRALSYYKKALELAPDERKVEILGKIISCEEQRVGAGGKLTREALEALWQRALIYREQGETEKAKEDLKRIYEADPSFRADQLIPLLQELGVEIQTPSEVESGKVQTPSESPGG